MFSGLRARYTRLYVGAHFPSLLSILSCVRVPSRSLEHFPSSVFRRNRTSRLLNAKCKCSVKALMITLDCLRLSEKNFKFEIMTSRLIFFNAIDALFMSELSPSARQTNAWNSDLVRPSASSLRSTYSRVAVDIESWRETFAI